MQPKPNIVHLPVYQPGKPVSDVKRELGLTEVIKLASNENPFGSSPKAIEAAKQELENISIYPDGAAVDLTNALAEHLGVEPDQIIFGAGSDEVILMIARAFLLPGDENITADQTFPQYRHNIEIENGVVIEVPLKDGTHDLDGMLAKVGPKTKIVWICNPNNPTGTIVTHEQVESFLAKVPSSVMVVLDEAYCEYIDDPAFPDGLALLKKYPNLVLLRTFSKIYGLASMRIGYGIGRPELIRSINQVREPFNTSRMGQAAALAAIKDQDFIDYCRKANAEGLKTLRAAFDRLGLPAFPAYGNFIMVDVKRPAGEVFDALLRKGIIVRGGHKYYPTHIRITVGSAEQNAKVISALEAVLQEIPVQV
ncbi:histidinol-phosphate transaminase [Cohnella thailandensis]|uniref:Histidinol-phosphate aminotransferase n=1 Tax=Cohnella thailandensis TaxID=557557 RepID=A0A841STW2_9BACL|nr:histidinol-phosphate transaminase [Cohnella thailandensis]MBB6635374.1 histidinol-phosphate transaminase [Cohnella thailandensis]MBP1974754.1 histidinol-phosphate aminotransferase [Cohnella thailandensis]